MVYFKETLDTVVAASAFNSFPQGAATTTKQQLKTPIVLARQGQNVWQLLKLEQLEGYDAPHSSSVHRIKSGSRSQLHVSFKSTEPNKCGVKHIPWSFWGNLTAKPFNILISNKTYCWWDLLVSGFVGILADCPRCPPQTILFSSIFAFDYLCWQPHFLMLGQVGLPRARLHIEERAEQ